MSELSQEKRGLNNTKKIEEKENESNENLSYSNTNLSNPCFSSCVVSRVRTRTFTNEQATIGGILLLAYLCSMPSNSQSSVDVDEDSYCDTPSLLDEDEHELYDSH
ncbi:hypothetical protein HAX54_018276, partial [Datura stramonium]|nr:hypothetical protein [Datura stramonium]